MGEARERVVDMNSGYPPACREIAQIAQDLGILEAIPEHEDVLVLVVNKLLQQVSVIPEHISDNFASPIAE